VGKVKQYVHDKYAGKVGIAEEMYVQKDFAMKDIAEQLDIPPRVVYGWRKKYDWDAKKIMDQNVFRNFLLSLEMKLEELGKELSGIKLDDPSFASKTDGITKLLGQIHKLRNMYDQDFLRSSIRVMQEYATHVRRMNLTEEQVGIVHKTIDSFFSESRKKYK
jgi:hypothetical protein